MPIPLAQALAETFTGWIDTLPEAWRPLAEGIDLDGSSVEPELRFDPWVPIFPPLQGRVGVLGAPRRAETFRAFSDLSPQDVRAVIVGQDPYPDVAKATGLSFEQGNIKSWVEDARLVSKSLRRIVQAAAALEGDDGDRYIGSRGWGHVLADIASGELSARTPTEFFDDTREQGVLWLNTTLSISLFRGEGAYDHQQGHRAFWEPFVSHVLDYLAARSEPVVFVLWGGWAKDLRSGLEQAAEAAGTLGSLGFAESYHPATPRFLRPNPLQLVDDGLDRLGEEPVDWL